MNYVEEYRKAYDHVWAEGLERHVPSYMIDGMVRYIVFGIMPGSFLKAVLEGDLFSAVKNADDFNAGRLPSYVRFLYNYAPQDCYGSPENVKAWAAQQQELYNATSD